jgi:hypothetical protein
MPNEQLLGELRRLTSDHNHPVKKVLADAYEVNIYPCSIIEQSGVLFLIAKQGLDKHLYLVSERPQPPVFSALTGNDLAEGIRQCPLSHENALAIQAIFSFTKPVLVGLDDSIGLGCRIGLANPGHLRAVQGTGIKPILAQQSIRELQRTNREAEEVMDAAIWAVLQEGYRDGFGSDADHLKTTADIDRMVKAGYTMFTFDPSEHVVNEADGLDMAQLDKKATLIPWHDLDDSFDSFLARYQDKTYRVADDLVIHPDKEQVLRGLVKYGAAIAHIKRLYQYFCDTYPDYPFELEISVDETDSVTTPFEHMLVASEMRRLNIEVVSLAPRFVGDFEKGIDYKGDLKLFREEYIKHLKISEAYGPYKISIHSGSDKFGVYAVIGSLQQGHVHVKTAGTSYLEALKAAAIRQPALFREILDFSSGLYEQEKRTYHVSADVGKVRKAQQYRDDELAGLFDSNDVRQVLHVTFGKVLTTKDERGDYLFRDRLLHCLAKNEDTYYDLLQAHFTKHVMPFVR